MRTARNDKFVKWRGLIIALSLALVAAITSFAEPLDRLVEILNGRLAWRDVSGQTVIVGVDDTTLAHTKYADFDRLDQAAALQAIADAGARRIYLDLEYERPDNYGGIEALSETIVGIGDRMALGVSSRSGSKPDDLRHIYPPATFGSHAHLVSLAWEFEFWQVWNVPTMYRIGDRLIPSVAASIANVKSASEDSFRIDFSYRPDSIPHYSASDLLTGKVGRRELAGKNVIFGLTSISGKDFHHLPGHDLVPGPFIHLIAAETLQRGTPTSIGWIAPLLVTFVVLGQYILRRKTKKFLLISGCMAVALCASKLILAQFLVHSTIGPSLVFTLALATIVARTRQHEKAQRLNPISGLPNFSAIASQPQYIDEVVLVAKLADFDDLNAFLTAEDSREVIEQVTRRLQIASQGRILYHDTDGSFAWMVMPTTQPTIEDQMAGISALFNNPIALASQRIDINLAFGIDEDFRSPLMRRLSASRSAAEKAARKRVLWERASHSGSEDTSWKLSFQSQLDEGMNQGDIWVAYQPQYEISTGKMVGVEALARWTHPERGNIPPDQFIQLAEKTQNIYRLTLFIMERAIQSGAQLIHSGHDVQLSVNMSAMLLDHPELESAIHSLLKAHRLPTDKLTLEITETAQFADSLQAINTLTQLRQSGIRFSIDDYGTGQSNLAYLTQIDAHEIKIDKRFVKTMRESQRNFEIVKSTIDLAHRLGAVAVAEGIEDAATLSLLEKLGCDVAQGYHLGKPQLFFEIIAELEGSSIIKSA